MEPRYLSFGKKKERCGHALDTLSACRAGLRCKPAARPYSLVIFAWPHTDIIVAMYGEDSIAVVLNDWVEGIMESPVPLLGLTCWADRQFF